MPNGNQLPFTWEEYKAYLKKVTEGINYPGFRDAPERAEDLERRISEAEALLGANPEAAFTAANLSRLLQLPYFAKAFGEATGTSLSSWYTTYTKALPEVPEEEVPWEEQLRRQRELLELEWGIEARVTPQELWEREQEKREFGWQQERAMLPYEQMTVAEQAQVAQRQREWQAGLMARPSDWIERWYAMNMPLPEARREERGQVPWVSWTEPERQQYLQTGTTPGGYQVRPEAEWLMQAPQAGRMVTTDPEALQAGFIDPAEHERALAEREAMVAPTKVTVSPTGEVSITTPSGEAPMAGRAAYQAPREQALGIGGMRGQTYAGVTGPYAEAPAERKKPRARKPRPTAPPTPPWLTKFAPWLTAGQPITRGPARDRIKEGVAQRGISPPSGELWAQTPWSERRGLAGYLGWAGGRPLEDIEDIMAMMRPETPMGVAGRRWQPARQRV